jgi:hypothetical protein
VLQPARVITGRVTYADSGKPTPHASLSVLGIPVSVLFSGVLPRPDDVQTDDDGRFRINAPPTDNVTLYAQALAGQPYLGASRRIDWPKGAVEQSVALSLPRGAVVSGKVTEEGSGKPVAGAVVRFAPSERRGLPGVWDAPYLSTSDGSFQLAALPGPGYVVVQASSDDYVLREVGITGGAFFSKPGSRRFYAHGYAYLDKRAGGATPDVKIVLQPGATVKFQVLWPHNRPVDDAVVISRPIVESQASGGWRAPGQRSLGRVRDGRFELHGLDSLTDVPVHFLDYHHEMAATVHVSGKSAAGGPVTVRLDRCSTGKVRLVDPAGKPVADYRRPSVVLLLTPGPMFDGRIEKVGTLFATEYSLPGVDPAHYPMHPASDAEGRLLLPALIPGATYRIFDLTTGAPGDARGPTVRKEFTVNPGETLDLGDILIEKPQA